jgi:hypothetical protein
MSDTDAEDKNKDYRFDVNIARALFNLVNSLTMSYEEADTPYGDYWQDSVEHWRHSLNFWLNAKNSKKGGNG